jgi:hypothetical protein
MSQKEQSDAMDECLAFAEQLRRGGHWSSPGEALQSARTAKTLRWRGGKVLVTDGPFAETKEQLGGFFVFEATDMNHAVELISMHPGIRHGPMELRAADEQVNALVAKRQPRFEQRTGRNTRRFICLGYSDEAAWDGMSQSEQAAMMEEGLAYDDELRSKGHTVTPGDALQSARTAKTLRWQAGKVVVTDGPFAETKEQLGGFGIIEAKDLEQAIELLLHHPCVRCGPIEVRPVDEQIKTLVEERLPQATAAP